jgi:hypothetical protein
MSAAGSVTDALRGANREALVELGRSGRRIVETHYDSTLLRQAYLQKYAAIAETPVDLPGYSMKSRLTANLKNAVRRTVRRLGQWVEE